MNVNWIDQGDLNQVTFIIQEFQFVAVNSILQSQMSEQHKVWWLFKILEMDLTACAAVLKGRPTAVTGQLLENKFFGLGSVDDAYSEHAGHVFQVTFNFNVSEVSQAAYLVRHFRPAVIRHVLQSSLTRAEKVCILLKLKLQPLDGCWELFKNAGMNDAWLAPRLQVHWTTNLMQISRNHDAEIVTRVNRIMEELNGAKVNGKPQITSNFLKGITGALLRKKKIRYSFRTMSGPMDIETHEENFSNEKACIVIHNCVDPKFNSNFKEINDPDQELMKKVSQAYPPQEQIEIYRLIQLLNFCCSDSIFDPLVDQLQQCEFVAGENRAMLDMIKFALNFRAPPKYRCDLKNVYFKNTVPVFAWKLDEIKPLSLEVLDNVLSKFNHLKSNFYADSGNESLESLEFPFPAYLKVLQRANHCVFKNKNAFQKIYSPGLSQLRKELEPHVNHHKQLYRIPNLVVSLADAAWVWALVDFLRPNSDEYFKLMQKMVYFNGQMHIESDEKECNDGNRIGLLARYLMIDQGRLDSERVGGLESLFVNHQTESVLTELSPFYRFHFFVLLNDVYYEFYKIDQAFHACRIVHANKPYTTEIHDTICGLESAAEFADQTIGRPDDMNVQVTFAASGHNLHQKTVAELIMIYILRNNLSGNDSILLKSYLDHSQMAQNRDLKGYENFDTLLGLVCAEMVAENEKTTSDQDTLYKIITNQIDYSRPLV